MEQTEILNSEVTSSDLDVHSGEAQHTSGGSEQAWKYRD